MKAYIIKIELLDSEPLIWRRVIMPADATFKRLHDVIQTATNFQSGYPYGGYHLYRFEVPEANLYVTDDEEAYLDHQLYKKNKKKYDEQLRLAPPKSVERYYLELMMKEVRYPSRIKIDKYLEGGNTILYFYDFGDGWEFIVTLEKIVNDYHFGFPTLLDGAETAPPEDAGGLGGFYEFLEIYSDESHPEHEETKIWAESQNFREYDPKWINDRLKNVKYKFTEWQEIEHDNYRIIEDKYRKE